MKKVITVLFLFINTVLPTLAKLQQRDDLEIPHQHQSDNERIQSLIILANQITYSSPTEAIDVANQAISLATRHNEKSLMYQALKERGYANGYAGNTDAAMKDMEEGLIYYRSIGDSLKIAEAISDIGYLHQTLGAYDKALDHFQKSLSIREIIKDQKGIAYSLNNIGALYWRLGKIEEALDYHLKAISFFEQNNMLEETGIATANLGEIFILKGDEVAALQYFNQSLSINKKLGQHIFEANNLNSIGSIYLQRKDTELAERFFSNAIALQRKTADKNGRALSHYNLGRTYFVQGKLSEALMNLITSVSLADTCQNNDLLIKALRETSIISSRLGDYQQAYIALHRAGTLADSIFNLEKSRQLEELKTSYETEKHQLENANLKFKNQNNEIIIRQHRILFILIIILSFFISLSVWLFLLKRRSAEKVKAIELEQRLLRSQMNPHFIFNTLSVIQNFIIQNTTRQAVNLISSMATLMRLTLENSTNEFIPFEQEINTLKLYISLQHHRFEEQFTYNINIDPNLSKLPISVPPMLIQPFVENAIEHGFSGINYTGSLHVTYQMTEQGLRCEVEDNGIGYSASIQNKKGTNPHRAYGLEITRQRIEVLKKKYKMCANVDIIDKNNGDQTGTLIRIYLPYKAINIP